MKKNPCLSIGLIFLVIAGIACNTSYQNNSVHYVNYRVSDSIRKDEALDGLLKNYREEVQKTMNEVIGFADHNLDKEELGRFLVRAYMEMGMSKYNMRIDASFMNPGGIRLNQIPAGPVTNGKIFELMPFDNILVLQKMKGTDLQEYLDRIAGKGKWPMAGIEMEVREKKAFNVRVGGKPIHPSATYSIAHSDFLANGGEYLDMLKTIPQINNGYVVREAIFDYIKKLKSQGKPIGAE